MMKHFIFPNWKALYYDLVWAFFSAIIGSLCFSIFANLIMADNWAIYLQPILIIWLFSLLFSFIPTIVFGGALSIVLHSIPNISKSRTYLLGGIIGGLSSIVIDVGVLYVANIDLDIKTFVCALAAIAVAVICGVWVTGKIFTSITSDLSEVTK